MFESIRREIQAIKDRDPAARSSAEILTLYPGLHAILLHRPAHHLYRRGHFYSARLLSQLGRFLTGIEIHPGAKLGRGILIDHGSGVVIGETAVVGDNCILYQGVTLGGTGKDVGKRHPTLGKDVIVGAGAKVLGPFRIGDGAKIASNAVVLKPLPPGATAVGVPARIVKVNGRRICAPLDHVHIPDPVAQELEKLCRDIAKLERKVEKLEAGANPAKEGQQS
ncbi:MAG: serine O-acetyltransferase [Oscillospiraceae bacterium]